MLTPKIAFGLTLSHGLVSVIASPFPKGRMDNIFISLRDGKVLDVPRGTTALDVAKQISPRLASAALVARVSYGVKPGPGVGAAEDAASGNANAVSESDSPLPRRLLCVYCTDPRGP